MPLTAAGKNRMLDALAGSATGSPIAYLSLHSGIPDASGSNEIAGGAPAYARKAVTFAAASSGAISKNGTSPVFDVVGATTVFFVGYWTAVTGGTFLGYNPVNGGAVDGFATVNASGEAATNYAHGLVNDDRIILKAPPGGALPTGLDAATIYFVVGATTDTFQMSITSAGSPVNVTVSGEMYFQKAVGEVFTIQGTMTVNTLSVSLN